MKDMNKYILEKLHLNKDINRAFTDEELNDIFNFIVKFYTHGKQNSYHLSYKYNLCVNIDKKDAKYPFSIEFDHNRLNDDSLKKCMNSGTELCTEIQNELGFDLYWSKKLPNKIYLSPDFI